MPWRLRGFTLIELLVVLLLIGVIAGFAVLSVGDGGQEAAVEREAKRVAALVSLGSEEAVLQSRELAVHFTREGYRFYRLENGSWLALADPVLGPRQLPAGTLLELEVEGMPADLDTRAEEDGPHLFLLSSGEMTPFELRLRVEESGRAYTVRGDFGGEVTMERPPGE